VIRFTLYKLNDKLWHLPQGGTFYSLLTKCKENLGGMSFSPCLLIYPDSDIVPPQEELCPICFKNDFEKRLKLASHINQQKNHNELWYCDMTMSTSLCNPTSMNILFRNYKFNISVELVGGVETASEFTTLSKYNDKFKW
jgi:hypothetical protein